VNSPPPRPPLPSQPSLPPRPQLPPRLSPDLPPAADAEAVRIFEEEVRSAVSYEKGLALKALIALAVVVMVVALRVLYLG
jgi:hypothetical protein